MRVSLLKVISVTFVASKTLLTIIFHTRTFTGVAQDNLETVVPKSEGEYVYVVSGKHRGQRGKILKVSVFRMVGS